MGSFDTLMACIHIIPEWLELLCLTFCIGTLVCRLWVLENSTQFESPPQQSLVTSRWRGFGIVTVVMIASSIGDLLVRAVEMSGQPLSEVFPVLPTVVFHTHLGHAWLIRIAAFILLAVMVKAGNRYRDSRRYLYLMLGVGLVASMTKSATGHAADAGDFSVPEIIDWLHLLATLAWGGGLFVLSLGILPKIIKQDDQAAPLIAGVVGRFSRIAGFAVVVIALTAVYNAVTQVGSVDALLEAPYGRIIIVKSFLLFFLLNLGAFNRYAVLPLLRKWEGSLVVEQGIVGHVTAICFSPLLHGLDGRQVARQLERNVRFEAFLMVGVLLCATTLRHQIPARHFLHLQHAQTAGAHEHIHHAATGPEPIVHLETNPAHVTAGTPVEMTVHLQEGGGKPVEGLMLHHDRILHAIIIGRDLNVFAHIHPEDKGPVTDEMLRSATFPLHFTFPKAGEYLVGFDFATAEGLYSKTSLISIAGQPKMGEPKIDLSAEKDSGGYHVSLLRSSESIIAGRKTSFRYLITRNGKPITDLEPYLGAPMHLAVVRSDLSWFTHAHGVLPGKSHVPDHEEIEPSERFGPEIAAETVFPAKGVYKIFSQVKHQGRVILFDFMVNVRS